MTCRFLCFSGAPSLQSCNWSVTNWSAHHPDTKLSSFSYSSQTGECRGFKFGKCRLVKSSGWNTYKATQPVYDGGPVELAKSP